MTGFSGNILTKSFSMLRPFWTRTMVVWKLVTASSMSLGIPQSKIQETSAPEGVGYLLSCRGMDVRDIFGGDNNEVERRAVLSHRN